jgi:hypothetical protein
MMLLLLLVACAVPGSVGLEDRKDGGEQEGQEEEPPSVGLVIEPSALDFGAARRGEPVGATLVLHNEGDAEVVVEALEVSGDGAFTVLGGAGALAAGESADVRVSWTPTTAADTGELTVRSNDALNPTLVVPLAGVALREELAFDPDMVTIEGVPSGGHGEATTRLLNRGTAPVEVDTVTAFGDGWTVATDRRLPTTLEPGAEIVVEVGWDATSEADDEGQIRARAVSGDATARAEATRSFEGILGRACDPLGYEWLGGVDAWVDVDTDGDGTLETRVEGRSDPDGWFLLDPVPDGVWTLQIAKGAFSASRSVTVSGASGEPGVELCLGTEGVRFAVVNGFDEVEHHLDVLGIAYDSDFGYETLPDDPDGFAAYAAVILNCGDGSVPSAAQLEALAGFVRAGGGVLATDREAVAVAHAWPGTLDLWGPTDTTADSALGRYGTVTGDIADPGLAADLGLGAVSFAFEEYDWVVMAPMQPGTEVLVAGTVSTFEGAVYVPLAVRFDAGGPVYVTSFHDVDQVHREALAVLDQFILEL